MTLSSPFGKVFNLLALYHYRDALEINELQLGFKSHHLTNHYTLVAKKLLPTMSVMVQMYILERLTCRKHLKE